MIPRIVQVKHQYIYKIETSETPTIFHISTILKIKKNKKIKNKKLFTQHKTFLKPNKRKTHHTHKPYFS